MKQLIFIKGLLDITILIVYVHVITLKLNKLVGLPQDVHVVLRNGTRLPVEVIEITI